MMRSDFALTTGVTSGRLIVDCLEARSVISSYVGSSAECQFIAASPTRRVGGCLHHVEAGERPVIHSEKDLSAGRTERLMTLTFIDLSTNLSIDECRSSSEDIRCVSWS
jgi:hypothetical protein